jgi:hypothetical protein
MPRKREDVIGNRYGRLVVMEDAPNMGQCPSNPYGRRAVNAQCDCGNELEVRLHNLKSGHTVSCGCYNREKAAERLANNTHNLKHGHNRGNGRVSPEYRSWKNMVQRCTNSKAINYSNYGGRGITIDPRWLGEGGFENFLADMGPCPVDSKGRRTHTLDRISPNSNYGPGLCRWSTYKTQANNQRLRKPSRRARMASNGSDKAHTIQGEGKLDEYSTGGSHA